MKLYSGSIDPFSHRCRIVLFEKGMDFEVVDVDLANKPEDLAILSPHNSVPVLVERDLVLTDANIINEYIDERFPHPQLMPTDPVMRARTRLFIDDFEKQLFVHIPALESSDEARKEIARKHVRDNLLLIVPIFSVQQYLLSDEFSMLDVVLAPLLWRLDYYGIELPNQAVPLLYYADQIFTRPAFFDSLTSSEKTMKDHAILARYHLIGYRRAAEERRKWGAIMKKNEVKSAKQEKAKLKTTPKMINTVKSSKKLKRGLRKNKNAVGGAINKQMNSDPELKLDILDMLLKKYKT